MVDTDIKSTKERVETPPPALLFEMIRSFVALAGTLNLSQAVKVLGSTRQTLRRHIASLEERMGGPLFIVDDRRYQLSALGEAALPDAKDILARGVTWLDGGSSVVGGLQHLKAQVDGWNYYQEQKPLGQIWTRSSLVLRETLRAWVMSGGQIESPHLSHVRPYLMIYRETNNEWICVEFGTKSAYVHWFGLDYARSSIGRPILQLPAGEAFGHMLNSGFREIQATQSARLDHVFTPMPQSNNEKTVAMAYQRLMMAAFFPDQSPAVLALVVPTEKVEIEGLDPEKLNDIVDFSSWEFDPKDAKFESLNMD